MQKSFGIRMSWKACTVAIFLVAVPFAFTGCAYDSEEVLYPSNFCDTTSVGYAADILPIVQANCALSGCHVAGGSGTGNFTTYAALKAQVDNGRLLPSINQESNATAMPPDGRLSDCEINKFTLWVQQGAPQN
jgi:hypothetical protein